MRSSLASRLFLLLTGASGTLFLLTLPLSYGAETVEISTDGRITKEVDQLILLDQELKEACEDAKETLVAYADAKFKLVNLSQGILDEQNATDGMATKIREVEDIKETIKTLTDGIDAAIRDVNARQILDLKQKLELLHSRELERRAKLKEKEALEKKRKKRMKKAALLKSSSNIPDGAILKEDLHDLVDVKAILEKSDEELEKWFLELVEHEVEALHSELEETVIEATTNLGEMEKEVVEDVDAREEDCSGASLTDAVQIVQQELVKFSNDKVGMYDHLTHAKVVHHLTSNNYVPPSHLYSPLEDSWWYPYLPQDWERLFDSYLPNDWRKWNVAVPDYLYHTFGMTTRAKTAPPEAILQHNIYPGSCWPMDGQSGHVTLRLPYPVKVKAVTIDHASKLLFDKDEQRTSAPKDIRVFGYKPCWKEKVAGSAGGVDQSDYLDDYGSNNDNDSEYVRGVCDDGLDFDIAVPIVLHDFVFEQDGPSIQTFHIPQPEEDEGSCSEKADTCGGSLDGPDGQISYSPPVESSVDEAVSAIRLEITDNWGNEDYTCVYRFRIHGDAVDPKEN